MKSMRTSHLILASVVLTTCLVVAACDIGEPIPVECVCKCDEAPGAAKAAAPAPAPAAAAPVRPKPTNDQRAERARAARAAAAARRRGQGASKAQGQVAGEPGSGTKIDLPAAEQKEMVETYLGFLKAAADQKLPTMKPFMTERLGTSVEKNMPKYKDRFFRGLDKSIAATKTGRAKLVETRNMTGGNTEALFRYTDGSERRVVFFKEGGKWLLNRL